MDLANLGWRSVIELGVSKGCSKSVFELLVLGFFAVLTVLVDDECKAERLEEKDNDSESVGVDLKLEWSFSLSI